jgi:hypothetical protein
VSIPDVDTHRQAQQSRIAKPNELLLSVTRAHSQRHTRQGVQATKGVEFSRLSGWCRDSRGLAELLCLSVTVRWVATFTLYLPDAVLARVDELRGPTSRSGFIRAQLELLGPHAVPERSPEPAVDLKPPREPLVQSKEEMWRAMPLSRSELFARATQKRP